MVKTDYLFPMDAETPDLPGSLRPTSTSPFVGRAAELEKLRTLMPRAAGEGRRVALLAGEPGAGKSRLAREFAGEAAAEGALVLYGACDAVVRTPYGPFVEALDRLVRVTEADELRAALGAGGGELTRLLPDLPALVGELPEPVEADPDTERHRLHTAVADLLANVSREQADAARARGRALGRRPDAAAAAAPGALGLERPPAAPRDLPRHRGRRAGRALGDARRPAPLRRRRANAALGLSPGPRSPTWSAAPPEATRRDPELGELAATIHDLTGGNAFLVCELWRALVETGIVEVAGGQVRVTRPLTELGTPESVREVVSQRLSRLAPRTTDLLELAAVAGPEFELEPIRRAAGLAEPELLAALEEAVGSGMIEELPSQRLACRFTHEIVRRRALRPALAAAAGGAPPPRRRRRSRAPAPPPTARSRTSPITSAPPPRSAGAERAIDYNLRAAGAASAALAFDDAAMRLRTAIEIGIEDEPERAEALLELGSASHRAGQGDRCAGGLRGRRRRSPARLDSAELLARAAIGYEEACWRPGIASRRRGRAARGGARGGRRARATSCGSACWPGSPGRSASRASAERGAIVRGNAVALARGLEDRTALAKVLVRSYWARGTTPLEEILAMLTEARDLAEELGDAEIRDRGDGLARADLRRPLRPRVRPGARSRILREMAERTAQPFMNHVAEHYGSAIALCDGNLAEAEAMAERSREWGRLLTGRDASGTYGIQMFGIRREQGRLAELAPAVRILAGQVDREGPWRPGLVAVLAELGMEREARRELSSLAAEGIDGFRTSLWLATLAYLTDACAALGDEAMAAIVYPELEPLAGTNVMIGHLVACYGAADRYLGMLAATLGEPARAEEHFERAMDAEQADGSVDLGGPHRLRVRALPARAGPRGARAGGGPARRGRHPGRADRHGGAARKDPLARRRRSRASAFPTGSPRARRRSWSWSPTGLSNREIGEELSISEHTAANHIRSILRKTDCANRTEAASYAHRHGLASG